MFILGKLPRCWCHPFAFTRRADRHTNNRQSRLLPPSPEHWNDPEELSRVPNRAQRDTTAWQWTTYRIIIVLDNSYTCIHQRNYSNDNFLGPSKGNGKALLLLPHLEIDLRGLRPGPDINA
jgi:hypothetical protein